MGETEKRRPKRKVTTYRDLDVYKMAINGTMQIFRLTKNFPIEEKFSLTDQIRRSSRSVCANLAEAWRKRRYKFAFVSKLSDAETEVAETQVWTEVAFRCGYLDRTCFQEIDMYSYWNFNKMESQQHLILRNKVLDSDKHLSLIRPSPAPILKSVYALFITLAINKKSICNVDRHSVK